MNRPNDRGWNELRPIEFIVGFTDHPDGSVLVQMGKTMVLCAATIEEKVPPFLRGSGTGWLTAEYSLLPASTGTRTQREASKGKLTGRTQEIQRLIGRSLRAVFDLNVLGEKTIWVDCDVLQADGGTRTAAISGSFVAVALAVDKLLARGAITQNPIKDYLAAVSVGIVESENLLDLEYVEDSAADVDMNIIMTGSGQLVEVQGTGEKSVFSRQQLDELLDLGEKGIHSIIELQKQVLQKDVIHHA